MLSFIFDKWNKLLGNLEVATEERLEVCISSMYRILHDRTVNVKDVRNGDNMVTRNKQAYTVSLVDND